jgi:DNA-binding transcriptional regulator YbjK
MKGHIRKEQILQAACRLSSQPGGWFDLTRRNVAEEADCPDSLVNKYFGTMDKLKDAVISHAIVIENLKILEQGLIYGNKIARNAPKNLISKIKKG